MNNAAIQSATFTKICALQVTELVERLEKMQKTEHPSISPSASFSHINAEIFEISYVSRKLLKICSLARDQICTNNHDQISFEEIMGKLHDKIAKDDERDSCPEPLSDKHARKIERQKIRKERSERRGKRKLRKPTIETEDNTKNDPIQDTKRTHLSEASGLEANTETETESVKQPVYTVTPRAKMPNFIMNGRGIFIPNAEPLYNGWRNGFEIPERYVGIFD